MQAEEEWKSNIKWILRGSKRKPSESTQELELWHARYTKFFAASMMPYSLSSRCAASGKSSRLVMCVEGSASATDHLC